MFLETKLLIDLPKWVALNAIPSSRDHGVICWGHLGLGDLISNASVIEHLLTWNRIVVLPIKERNFDFFRATYGSWDGIVLAKISNEPALENREILKIKLKTGYRVEIIGHHLLTNDWDLQPISLNEQFQCLAGIPTSDLKSIRFRRSCEKLPQVDVPGEPYIFVDDHPGTPREVPQMFLKEAIERGLRVVRNDLSVPLYSLLDVLDNAEEIHMVASAPLCFALTVGAESKRKIYYRTKDQGPVASTAYPDWVDIDLR